MAIRKLTGRLQARVAPTAHVRADPWRVGGVLAARAEVPQAELRAAGEPAADPLAVPVTIAAAELRQDIRVDGGIAIPPTFTAEPRRAVRVTGDLPSRVDLPAALLERLPKSQSVLLSFELDRTLVPYTAERR